eukprot:7381206-Pyramimonas_sp.AAC.1
MTYTLPRVDGELKAEHLVLRLILAHRRTRLDGRDTEHYILKPCPSNCYVLNAFLIAPFIAMLGPLRLNATGIAVELSDLSLPVICPSRAPACTANFAQAVLGKCRAASTF